MPTRREREYYRMGFEDGVRQERSYGFTGEQQDRPFLVKKNETKGGNQRPY